MEKKKRFRGTKGSGRKRRAQQKDIFALSLQEEECRINCRDEEIYIFPGENNDKTLITKSLRENGKKVKREVIGDPCIIPNFEKNIKH